MTPPATTRSAALLAAAIASAAVAGNASGRPEPEEQPGHEVRLSPAELTVAPEEPGAISLTLLPRPGYRIDRSGRDLAQLFRKVCAHRLPGGAEPLVVAHVGRVLQRGLAVSAHREPLWVVLLGPVVPVAVQRPHPPVEGQTLRARGFGEEVDVARSDEHTLDAGLTDPREVCPPGGQIVISVSMDPCPGFEGADTRKDNV